MYADGMLSIIKDIFAEWCVISQAPLIFAAFSVAVVILNWLFFRWLYSHQLRNEKSSSENYKGVIKLHEATISSLRTENENLRKDAPQKRGDGHPELSSVTHGNTAIRAMFTDLVSKRGVPIPTHPTDSTKWKRAIWDYSSADFERLAAARRLIETGLATVEEIEPGSYTLTGTSTISDLKNYDMGNRSKS